MKTTVRIGRKNIDVQESLVDRFVRWRDPVKGLERFRARVNIALVGGYTGGSKSRRSFKNWFTRGNDADADLLPDLPTLRERSRDLGRNEPLAAGAINTQCTNVVGAGLKLHAMIDRAYLGLSDEDADAWETGAERYFNLWASKAEYCDIAATTNFYGHQDIALRGSLENGDIFYLLPQKQRTGVPYRTRLKAIEADRVCNSDNKADTNKLAAGIEIDADGAPVKYHIARTHPGALRKRATEWDVVEAFGARSGRRNVLHLFEQRRPGQRRGAPYLAPVIESLKQLGRYTEAELMAAVVSGLFTVFIKQEDGAEPFENTNTGADSADNPHYEMGTGAIVQMGTGESIETANPGRPNAAFDPFVQAILRQIGSALEIPYELLVKHFTASYSASRAAFMEAWKFFKKRRAWLATYFCDPVYEAVITEGVISGALYAPGFLKDPRVRAAYLGAAWVGPGKGQIQEETEVKAAALRVKEGFSTIAQETAEMNGGDWDRNHRQRVKEANLRRKDGLAEDATKPAALPPPPPDDMDKQDNEED